MVTELLNFGHIFHFEGVLKKVEPNLEGHSHLADLAPAFWSFELPHFLGSAEVEV
jgi:hypothetical protein